MSRRRLTGSFWPSRTQELLLKIALAGPEEARSAWKKLRPELDLQTLDSASFVTLPLVYRSLEAAGTDDPLLPRLKGIYRSVWVRNNLLIERLQATAAAVHSGVSMLLVGSIGAALRYYPAPGFRPTPFIEFVVAKDAVASAVRAIGDAGWIAPVTGQWAGNEPLVLEDDQGALCVLRTSLTPDFALRGRQYWPEAVPVDARGETVHALSPTDDLLAAIVTGARLVPGGSIQWIVDADMILRSVPDQIDWERLVRVGTAAGQGLRLSAALGYLDSLVGPVAPAEIMRRLEKRRPSSRERLMYACTVWSISGLGSSPQAIAEHLSVTADCSAAETIAALPAFLRSRWRVERNRQLPLAGGRRVYRNLIRGGPHGHA